MANQYVIADREQMYLLPPAMADWLPDDHLAWFVIDVVSVVEVSALHRRYARGGPGRPAYDPRVMLALFIFAYANGERSSRKIERLCRTDISYRLVVGDHIPDHVTIARFRADHEEAIKDVFVDVLRLCAGAGLVSLGTIAIDGTKMGSDASLSANREAGWVGAEVERILKEAEVADDTEQGQHGSGACTRLPEKLAQRSSRLAHLRAAQVELEARQAEAEARAAREKAAAEEKAAEGHKIKGIKPSQDPRVAVARAQVDLDIARQRVAEEAAQRAEAEARAKAKGRQAPGRPPKPGASRRSQQLAEAEARLKAAEEAVAEADRAAKVNVTDPQSRIMKTKEGYLQGYNAQASVNQGQIVLAHDVTQSGVDVHQFLPMVAATQDMAKEVGVEDVIGNVVADAGYFSEENATAEGPQRLIATTKDHKQRRRARELGVCEGPPPEGASIREAMEHRLRTQEGAAIYAMRSQLVEPVFGDEKGNQGFRRFMRRGLAAAQSEWGLICAVHNLRKLFHHQRRARLLPAAGACA